MLFSDVVVLAFLLLGRNALALDASRCIDVVKEFQQFTILLDVSTITQMRKLPTENVTVSMGCMCRLTIIYWSLRLTISRISRCTRHPCRPHRFPLSFSSTLTETSAFMADKQH
jgi:hypothetical protein